MIKWFYWTYRWDRNRFDQSGQSGPGSNGNEVVLHNFANSGHRATPSDAIKCHTLGTR